MNYIINRWYNKHKMKWSIHWVKVEHKIWLIIYWQSIDSNRKWIGWLNNWLMELFRVK